MFHGDGNMLLSAKLQNEEKINVDENYQPSSFTEWNRTDVQLLYLIDCTNGQCTVISQSQAAKYRHSGNAISNGIVVTRLTAV